MVLTMLEWDMIDSSNERFAWILSKYLNEPIEILYQKLRNEYELIARTNPIARFNLERLYLSYIITNIKPIELIDIREHLIPF